MNDLDTNACQCTNCPGPECTCGCQSGGSACACAPARACGPTCQCGPDCACQSAVEG
jgi:hypothetical protein